MKAFRLAWALAALAIAAGACQAQDRDVLRGPAVVGERSVTLVRHSYDGRLERLDIPPGEAAVALLELDDDTLSQVEEVLGERAAQIDAVVREQFELLLEAYSAGVAEDEARQSYLFQELMMRMAPVRRDGRLRDRIAAVLAGQQRERYLSLVDGYWRAVARDGLRQRERTGEKGDRFGVVVEEGVRLLFKEIERSIERQIGDEPGEFEALLRALELRPEQERRIRGLVRRFGEENGLSATEADRAELFWEIFDELDREQRLRAVRELFGGRG